MEMILGVASSLFIILLCGVQPACGDPRPRPTTAADFLPCYDLACSFLDRGALWITLPRYLSGSQIGGVRVDDEGVRLKAALYRHIPLGRRRMAVGSARSMGRETWSLAPFWPKVEVSARWSGCSVRGAAEACHAGRPASPGERDRGYHPPPSQLLRQGRPRMIVFGGGATGHVALGGLGCLSIGPVMRSERLGASFPREVRP